jgi:hypothetical protein
MAKRRSKVKRSKARRSRKRSGDNEGLMAALVVVILIGLGVAYYVYHPKMSVTARPPAVSTPAAAPAAPPAPAPAAAPAAPPK